jgi:hypothetical protein
MMDLIWTFPILLFSTIMCNKNMSSLFRDNNKEGKRQLNGKSFEDVNNFEVIFIASL